jgi:hypothetical protein
VLIQGSSPGGCSAPPGVTMTLAAHGTALIGGPRRATVEVIAGAGVNRTCFTSVKPPRLGGNWVSELDVSQHPEASAVYVFGTDAALVPGRQTPFGELLVNPLGRRQLSLILPVTNGVSETLVVPIPHDPTLMGRTCFAQATILGGRLELCNALRLLIGF